MTHVFVWTLEDVLVLSVVAGIIVFAIVSVISDEIKAHKKGKRK